VNLPFCCWQEGVRSQVSGPREDSKSTFVLKPDTCAIQRKKRIFGFPGIIAPATTTTTITTTSSISPSECCPKRQTASAQLTSYCREGKLRKCRRTITERNTESAKRFSEADSTGNFGIRVGKHLGGESLDGSGLAPGIQRQTSFAAGLLQKSFPIPTMFDRYLG